MWQQLLQIGTGLFAAACAAMVLRTVAEVLPELVGLSRSSGEPVPVPVTGHDSRAGRRA